MKAVIDRILEGDFDYEKGSLDFSCSKLELSILPGEQCEGSFTIVGEEGRYTIGYVLSSDSRMECLTEEFLGCREEIAFRFHGEQLEEGEVIKGEFQVISNQGEYYLPFVVNVEYRVLNSSLGNIKNLFHFANLAKTNPEEAAALFYSEDFNRIFTGNDRQFYDYYRGLSAIPGNEQNIEEFLIGINKKQKIEYLTDVQEIRLEDVKEIVETAVQITRNGWGYGQLQVVTEGDFLYTEKSRISEADFLGNSYRLAVYVDESLLHMGNNCGCLRLIDRYGEKCIPIIVNQKGVGGRGRRRLYQKGLIVQLMQQYRDFRLKKTNSASWLQESSLLVEKMAAENEDDVPARLFQAQLLITEERYNEARWILDHTADILDSMEEEEPAWLAYYLYLTTLIQREESYVDEITEQVDYLYKKNREEWRIAWLLLYLSEELSKSFSKKWLFLEEQFGRGSRSPVIYIEALLLLNQNPSLLIKLGDFEKRVLFYGARYEMLQEDVVMQFIYLVQREREYSDCVYRILKACYKIKPDVRILQELCSLLIKGNKVGKEYFPWYEKGVEAELRITRLYEYYMMSVDTGTMEALPRMVLMYFAYQNSLNYDLAAFLYVNIHRHREKFPELYESYRDIIEQFITEQILKGRINRDLAYLYKNLLTERMFTPEVAQALGGLLFMNLVEVSAADIRYAIVCQAGFEGEIRYPVVEGRALVSLPGADSRLLFEDAYQNRYMVSVPYTIEKLMLPGKLMKLTAPLSGNIRDLNLSICLNGMEPVEITEENEIRFRYLLEDTGLQSRLRRNISRKLIRYYYDKDKLQELDECLEAISPEGYSVSERGELFRFLVIRGLKDKAFSWLTDYGPFGADPKVVVRLCSRVLQERELAEDAVIGEAVWYAFKLGKYDERGLQYLILYFQGMTKDMRDIYKAAHSFGEDSSILCERMLIQMLFTGSFVGEKIEIFRTYTAGGCRNDVVEAFLSQCAYEYFVKDRVTDAYVFEVITERYRQNEDLRQICKLAYVKFYAENKSRLTEESREIVRQFIRELLEEHIFLKMFTEFKDFRDSRINQLSDRTIVEYKAHPDARAILHYCMEAPEAQEPEYLTEEMRETVGGVCFKEFVLFFGESLQYYIVEEQGGNGQLTESASIQNSDMGGWNLESKFNLINDICISNTLQDYDTVDKLLEEYEYTEYIKNGLFKLR
ncbi:MAG: hypothetical protein J1E65_02935 [Lachnospiraceae bacterium]|nr:hypothetical protein [Lachnospiraceae bacterium]